MICVSKGLGEARATTLREVCFPLRAFAHRCFVYHATPRGVVRSEKPRDARNHGSMHMSINFKLPGASVRLAAGHCAISPMAQGGGAGPVDEIIPVDTI